MPIDNDIELTQEQWLFLAVLYAWGEDISINLAGILAPITPGPLFELLNQTKELGWVLQKGSDHFSISSTVPESIKERLKEINNPDHLRHLLDKLSESGMNEQTNPQVMLRLLEQAGCEKHAGKLLLAAAQKALEESCFETSWEQYQKAIEVFGNHLQIEENQPLYVESVLKLSNLTFMLGKGLHILPKLLERAHEIAHQIGDRRSLALLKLHKGRLHWFTDHSSELSEIIARGIKEVEELGDQDIINKSSGYIAISYFHQGNLQKALKYFEYSEYTIEKGQEGEYLGVSTRFATPFFMGFCLAYLGDFHRAIGSLECNWRLAIQKSLHSLATTLRASLGTILALINNNRQAYIHLNAALNDAIDHKNDIALRCALLGLALNNMKEGKSQEAHQLLNRAFTETKDPALGLNFSSPWVLEMLFEFNKLGFPPIPNVSYAQAIERINASDNIHLKGVVLRLEAEAKLSKGIDTTLVIKDLDMSIELLEKAKDPVQLSKSILAMARVEGKRNNITGARQLALKSWRLLGGYSELFFPDKFRHYIEYKQENYKNREYQQDLIERCLDLFSTVMPIGNEGEIYSRIVIATNRFFGAERGGLFWFPKGKYTKCPELLAGCNLMNSDINSPNFEPYRALILKAFREKKPILVRLGSGHDKKTKDNFKTVFCLPIETGGRMRGVLYHDNSYLEDGFNFLTPESLNILITHFNKLIDRVRKYCRLLEERETLISTISLNEATNSKEGLLYQSSIMEKLLSNVDKASKSDSTILILGNSGVGKELLARRIHSVSPRADKPFVIVDSTTIPETLFESELFGYEKGAFTGADKQKKGRIELAHQGTLFIDEVGELPKNVQAKLLRAIQEGSFNRVGGNKILHSDFRLITATNRDLEEHVKLGHFREDLYFRLNVIPFRLPSLKERQDDILLLAQHFIDRFAKKYNKTNRAIDQNTERILKNYPWPGNVRELENVIERAVLLSPDDHLEIDIPMHSPQEINNPFTDQPTLNEIQCRYIKYVLEKTNGKISGAGGAAEILGMPRTTLNARMKKLDIQLSR